MAVLIDCTKELDDPRPEEIKLICAGGLTLNICKVEAAIDIQCLELVDTDSPRLDVLEIPVIALPSLQRAINYAMKVYERELDLEICE